MPTQSNQDICLLSGSGSPGHSMINAQQPPTKAAHDAKEASMTPIPTKTRSQNPKPLRLGLVKWPNIEKSPSQAPTMSWWEPGAEPGFGITPTARQGGTSQLPQKQDSRLGQPAITFDPGSKDAIVGLAFETPLAGRKEFSSKIIAQLEFKW